MISEIKLTIPKDKPLLDLSGFSPEENYLMLEIGSNCLIEGRKYVSKFTKEEIRKEELKELEIKILVEKELNKQLEENLKNNLKNIYETQINKLKNELDNTKKLLYEYELDNKNIIQNEIIKLKDIEREKYELLLLEKDKQNHLNRETFDKATKLLKANTEIVKSSAKLGAEGEQIFEELSDITFKYFKDYRIENKSKEGHKGDYHLYFEEFNVLVDAKNYKTNIAKKEFDKILSNLFVNENMDFAWLISLNTDISNYKKYIITPVWSDDNKKCVLCINSLLKQTDPENILRLAWVMSNEINTFMKNTDDTNLINYKKQNNICKQLINQVKDRTVELRKNINNSLNILQQMDNELKSLLEIYSNDISVKYDIIYKIKEWWNKSIDDINDESIITSTEVWSKFKRENKDYITENKITVDIFKEKIISIIDNSRYNEKTKKGVIELFGYKIKEEQEEKVENIVIENIELIQKEKVTKTKNTKKGYCLNEEIDKKVLKDYDNINNDILMISEINKIKPFQVVSILVKHKKINKRTDARGYDKYKETEEYQNKLNNK
jgi:hypothetical protein